MSNILSKILRLIKRIYLFTYYYVKNVSSRKHYHAENNGVIISLTTFPARLDKVFLTIETIFAQSKSAERVILWLSSDEINEEDLPTSLIRLKSRGLEINFIEENFRSYKKLIYAYKLEKWKAIVTIDDDIFYPVNWFDAIYDTWKEAPEHVVCLRGHLLKKQAKELFVPYKNMTRIQYDSTIPSMNILPTGVGGVLYPKEALSALVADSELFLKLCPNADDIWFKVVTLLNGTYVKRVNSYKDYHLLTIPFSQKSSLYKLNLDEDKNDIQLNLTFKHFKIFHLIS